MKDKPLAYLEIKRPPKSDSALATNIIQHWQARHLYGKALVVVDSPVVIAKLARKRWLSVMQALQHDRATTSDADRLLTLTHSITRMQQMVIAAESPNEYPAAHLWLVTPEQLAKTDLPRVCRTIYLQAHLSDSTKEYLYKLLPSHSLVVNYTEDTNWSLHSKTELEEKVHHAWQELNTFLSRYSINPQALVNDSNVDAIDDALDTLLDNGSSFLRHTRHFQEALHLAQPLQPSFSLKKQHELVNLLARRVAMLTPGVLHHSFIQSENDTFSLYDVVSPQKYSRESLSAMVARHLAAGRNSLAKALETAFVNNLLIP